MDTCLIVFAKEPQKSRVKTRLAKSIGEENAFELYKAFIKDTIDIARYTNADKKIMAYASFSESPEFLMNTAKGFEFYEQDGADLGLRMHNTFTYAQGLGASKTVIIGSDSPALPSAYIDEAFSGLDECEVVLGPTQDGGYYLIGLKRPCRDLMKDIVWSSSSVFEQTMKNAENLGLSVKLLGMENDIDVIENLLRLKETLLGREDVAPFTREVLEAVDL